MGESMGNQETANFSLSRVKSSLRPLPYRYPIEIRVEKKDKKKFIGKNCTRDWSD